MTLHFSHFSADPYRPHSNICTVSIWAHRSLLTRMHRETIGGHFQCIRNWPLVRMTRKNFSFPYYTFTCKGPTSSSFPRSLVHAHYLIWNRSSEISHAWLSRCLMKDMFLGCLQKQTATMQIFQGTLR